MLHLRFANRFETLADGLIAALARPGASAFDADTVIVPSAAVQRALALRIADRLGACANVEFAFLAEWLWRRLGAPRWAPDYLEWRVHAAFERRRAWAGDHPRLSAYLERADAPTRLALARRIAAQFEQLLAYRPDWIEAWSAGAGGIAEPLASAAQRADAAWQAALWRAIVPADGAPATQAALHAAVAAAPAAEWPRTLHVYALPAIAPAHLALLAAIGARAEVVIHALDPSAEFWFDLVAPKRLAALAARGRAAHAEVGHPLLAAWGAQAQAHLGALVALEGDGVDDEHEVTPPEGDTLLARVQRSVLELAPIERRPLAEGDRSVEFHVAHSLARELEALHDRLLGLFASERPPALHEIVVVTPDLDAAAPVIDAVFGTVPRERQIPYRITGRARTGVNAPARALLALLALVGGRAPAGELAGFVAQPVVARRFGLDGDDLARVQRWLGDAGVHWAIDAAHRSALGFAAGASRVSLAEGVERLVVGHLLPGDAALPFAGVLPAGDAEGQSALALGALAEIAERLAAWRVRLAAPLPASEWPVLLEAAIADFIDARADDLDDLAELRRAIQRLGSAWSASGLLATPLPLLLVREALADALDTGARGGVPQGVVTFSSLSSLRGLAYRVVCAVGLDGAAFPAPSRADEWDLIAAAPRAGDRQRRSDDRGLFLDLLLSARDVLHLSWTGRSVRDNGVLPASVLVDELLEFLQPAVDADPMRARARLVVEHPLQPFDLARFTPDGDVRIASFDAGDAAAHRARRTVPSPAAAAAIVAGEDDDEQAAAVLEDLDFGDDDDGLPPFFAAPLPPPDAAAREVSAARLARFLAHPCRALLRERLLVRLPGRDDDDAVDDAEPLVVDGLARHALAQRVLAALVAGDADAANHPGSGGERGDPGGCGVRRDAAASAVADAGTAWPGGSLARLALDAERPWLGRHARALGTLLAPELLAPVDVRLAVEIDGATWTLAATLPDLRPGGLVRHRAARLRAGEWLAAWVDHLLLCHAAPAGVACVTTLLGRDERWRLDPVPGAAAELCALLRRMAAGLREPGAFHPRAAWALARPGGSESKARSEWSGGADPLRSEKADAWTRIALRGRPDPVATEFAAFAAAAHAVFDPLVAAAHEERDR